MGVGGKFWDLLKPYARNKGFDFLRNNRVAQRARNPLLRLTFFRTINLFSKMRNSNTKVGFVWNWVLVERNNTFTKCSNYLNLLGRPVLKAKREAETLCAQLNGDGHVDACITSDSDAFLFGAKCIIKTFQSNSKEPFESYYMSDIKTGLGLKRNHLISPLKTKFSHCSFYGHTGSKRTHFKSSCEFCINAVGEGCMKKSEGFKCSCSSCDMNWRLKVLSKIALEPNFPNDEIVEMYLRNNHGYFNENDGPRVSWESPKTEMLVQFLTYHQRWEPSYIRQRMLPRLSTIFREMAKNPVKSLLYGQYDEFNSIDRLKIRYGHQFYVESDMQQDDVMEVDESLSPLDESDVPTTDISGGCCFLLTDENMDLVHAAFPVEVDRFLQEKLNITKISRSAKTQYETELREDLTQNTDSQIAETSKEKRKPSSSNLPKSVRRRLLFD
ncbi:unnamed protein product [Malus baccata var. baccata]